MRREAIRETLYRLELKRRQILQPRFAAMGLSAGQPRILSCLRVRREGLTQRELAQVCNLEAATLSRALDKLVEEGLVSRTPHEKSRRSNLVVLTAAGEEKARGVGAAFDNMDTLLCWGFQEEELERVKELLERLEQNLDENVGGS